MSSLESSDIKSISKDGSEERATRTAKPRGRYMAIGILIAFAAFMARYFRPVVVDGPSMLPILHNGEWLTVSSCYWLFGPIRRKDIVVFQLPDHKGFIIKRVYKLAGEKVNYVNSPKGWSLSQPEYVVPKGDIYVLGDNRPQSDDSRSFGPIPLSNVIGKVIVFR